MSQKSIKKNYIYNVAYQILTLLTPLITAPYLSRVLQPDGIGKISYAESIVSYFSLFATMGITSYGQREISYAQDDLEKRSEAFWNTKILGIFTSGVVTIIYVIFAFFQKEDFPVYLVLSLNLVSLIFDISWFFQGIEDFEKTVTRNILFKALQIVYIFVFVKDKNDLVLYVLGLGLFATLGNLSLWAYIPKYVNRIQLSKLRPFNNFRTVWSMFIPTIAIQMYTVLDKTMIGIITNSSFENGYYEQAMKISKMLLTIISSLTSVMSPRMGAMFEKNMYDKAAEYLYRSYRFVWFLGIPLCLGVIATSNNFVPWFFGSEYNKVIILLNILSFLIIVSGISLITGWQLLIPSKREKVFSLTVIVGALVNISLNAFMIYYFKSVGAAIASVVAESVIALFQLVIVRKEVSLKRIIREGVHYYIAGAIMFVILLPMKFLLSPSVLNTVLMVIVGASSYFIVLLVEKDEFFIGNFLYIFQKIIGLKRK